MVSTIEPRIEIDERIRERPELLQAANEAMAYLARHIEGVSPPAVIRWGFAPLDPNTIELSLSDTSDFSDIVAKRRLEARHMNDSYRRDVFALWAFSDLLHERSKKNMARIDELMRRIDFDDLGSSDNGQNQHRRTMMAGKTPTELSDLIAVLRTELEVLRKDLELLRGTFDRAEVAQLRERLAKVESLLALLDPTALLTRVVTLEEQVTELKKWREERDRRWWQFWVGAGLVGVTFVANLVIQLILLFSRKIG